MTEMQNADIKLVSLYAEEGERECASRLWADVFNAQALEFVGDGSRIEIVCKKSSQDSRTLAYVSASFWRKDEEIAYALAKIGETDEDKIATRMQVILATPWVWREA